MSQHVPLSPIQVPAVRLERAAEVAARVGLGRCRIYVLIKAGQFPAPVRISERSVAWRSDEVDAWIATRPRAGSASRNTNAPGVKPEASHSAHVSA